MTELRFIARCALLLAGAAAGTHASGQVSPLAPSAAASAAAERAQRETDRTMYWIKVLAEKPAAKPAPAPAPKPVAAAPAPPPQNTRAAVAASDNRQAERMRLAAAAEATVAPAPTPSVVVAVPAAAAPTLPVPGAGGNQAKASSGGLDSGLPPAGATVALAAPAATAAALDIAPAEVDEPDPGLIMIKSADPQFPGAAMRRLRKGEVEVRFEVNADGMVDVVSVVKSSNSSLNSAALEAVRQWQFKPTPGHEHTASVALAFNMDN